MAYIDIASEKFGFFNPEKMGEAGKELHSDFSNATPFPHIVIDNFCSPAILDNCLEQFPPAPDPESETFHRSQERAKTSFNPDYLENEARSFFYSLNSRPFLSFLENVTGIQGLIPDPYYLGGGFHQTNEGGHLSVHADFNWHTKLNLERRINLLIYLNKDWDDEFGGELELWDKKMTACQKSVSPLFNRCVIFRTTADSYHGHPAPVRHPRGAARRSIAMYYYTATLDGSIRKFTSQFKARPGSPDKVDWRIKRNELIQDLMPPLLYRNFRRLTQKLAK